MKNYYSVILGCAALFAANLSTNAEIVIVESRTTGGTAGGITPNPPYQEVQGSWSGSGSHTTAPGTSSGIGSRFGFSAVTPPTIPPVLRISPTLLPNTTYRVSIAHISGNASPNLVVGITYEGCTGTATSTTAFSAARANVWEEVADITTGDGSIPPAIIFTYESGTLASTGGRWYSDAFRFQNEPCLFATVGELSTVNGPLPAGQAYVDVPGVSNTAQTVTVYADNVQIGQKTTGVTAGVNRVTTTPLVKGQMITASQSGPNGIESCRPVVGQFVGNGANPPFNLAITIRQTNATESVIGTNGGAPGSILKFIGATNVVGTLLAPLGTKTFYPSNDWQTITFHRGEDPTNSVDPTYNWNTPDATFGNVLAYNFGVLDALVFTSPQDTGPFAIYIDEFRNGDTLVQGFEDAALGQSGSTFTQPSFSGTTSGFLLAQPPGTIAPNTSVVTNRAADSGAQSLFVSWQFNTTNIASCLRLPAVATTAGSTPNPMLDLRLPITFRMLILPVGQEPPVKPAVATAGPGNQRVIRTRNITLRATWGGTPPFTFQWRHNGVDVPNGTNATLTITGAEPEDAGAYTLQVSNAYGSAESPSGTLTVEDVPFTGVMTPLWSLRAGSRPYLTNDSNTRSIAFNPFTEHLLVAGRNSIGGVTSNAIYILDGETGAQLGVLPEPAGGFVGGTLVLNQVGVAPDNGAIYACNLTTDGATTNLKIYRWLDEFDTAPIVIWEGNPAGNQDVHLRWGDSMIVREIGGFHEVVVSSGGTLVAFILLDFPPGGLADFGPAGVNAGELRLGLAMQGDILWGKSSGSPLHRIQLDGDLSGGTILNSFTGLGPMTAIGINGDGTLLGGIFVDLPDHFRLFDISTPGTITAVDTEFFPTDNANGNATGAIAFDGNRRIFALNSNNGLVAMNLNNLDCLPDRLTIEPSGSDVILRWSRNSYHLEGAPSLDGPWTGVPGASPATISAPGTRFFRLVCPAIP